MADLSKETYKKALAIVLGIETIKPGTTGRASRAALRAGTKAIIAGGRLAIPAAATTARVAAPAAVTLARQNPYAAAGLGALALQQAGAFDPVTDAIEAEVQRRVDDVNRGMEFLQSPGAQRSAVKIAKRKVSKYQKAVKAGMSAVKRSKFLGAKGKISNAKTAFSKVNKVASAVNKGRKVGTKGVTGVIKRAVGRWL